jgi:multiple sugar transport system substrate-binding protein
VPSSRLFTVLVLALAAGAMVACGGGGGGAGASGGKSVTLQYAMWEPEQVPAYKACATAFTRQNPNIKIHITQTIWDTYWNNLTTKLVSGDAPDVFADHLSKFPDFEKNGQIMDIEPLVKRDKVDTGIYIRGLANLWVHNGHRYGLPKDWDTIAIVYNKALVRKAGIDPKTLDNLTWNPQDGGTFGKVVARLSVDQRGHNGLDPAFDPKHVKTYGMVMTNFDATGQQDWSNFAASNGFQFTDRNPFGTRYNYGDPRLAQTLAWFRNEIVKGYMMPEVKASAAGGQPAMQAQKAALTTDGSWTISGYVATKGVQFGFAKLPKGPIGRKSMFNGLTDAIYAKTEHKEEAWKWVKFLASPQCENIVGRFGVVFPAIKTGVKNMLAFSKEHGVDISAYSDEADDPNGTFEFPITYHAADVVATITPVMDQIMRGDVNPFKALPAANQKVNQYLQQG